MAPAVMDSSAFLAMFWNEKGAGVAREYSGDYVMSAVNAAEAFTRILDKGPSETAKAQVLALLTSLTIIPFDEHQALDSAELRLPTRRLGLSLGDRACLSLAARRGAMVVTADRAWSELALGIEIRVIR